MRTARCVDKMPAVGKEEWESVRVLSARRVEFCRRGNDATRRGDLQQAAGRVRCKYDRAIGRPGAPSTIARRVDNGPSRSATDLNRLQFSLSEESKGSAIRRPKGMERILSTTQQLRLRCAKWTNPQSRPATRRFCHKRDQSTIRRDGDLRRDHARRWARERRLWRRQQRQLNRTGRSSGCRSGIGRGRDQVRSSYSTAPKAKMSVRASTAWPRTCSGAM